MKTRNILFLGLGLAMIQNQTSVASKHYLVETEDGKGLHSRAHTNFIFPKTFKLFQISHIKQMMMMSSLLIKLRMEVESDPWMKSYPMALRSRTSLASMAMLCSPP